MMRWSFAFLLLVRAGAYQSNSSPNKNAMPRRKVLEKAAAVVGSSLLVPPTGASAAAAIATAAAGAAAASSSSLPPVKIDAKGKATLPPMGLGAWAWGDALFWGYRPSEDEELQRVFNYAVEKGAGFFDTAELYGLGRSENLIKDFTASPEVVAKTSVATKFAALPWRTKRGDVVKAAQASVERLGRPIDLYQIHFPGAWANEAYWDGLGDAFDKGLVRSVGVSNYGKEAVRACHAKLAERGIPLSSNQVQMSLLYRCPLENGLKEVHDELGMSTIAYSPLGLGLLTGKYNAEKLPSGPRGKLAKDLFRQQPEAAARLFATMNDIAAAHGSGGGGGGGGGGGVSLSQVALNWGIAKGATVIPGARTLKQAQQNLAALDWKLSAAEVAALDAAAAPLPPLVPPEKAAFPKADKDTGMIMFDS